MRDAFVWIGIETQRLRVTKAIQETRRLLSGIPGAS